MFSDKIFLDANYKYHTAIGTPESPSTTSGTKNQYLTFSQLVLDTSSNFYL